LISYGRANLDDGSSLEIENPDFGLWDKRDIEISANSIEDKFERYPLERIGGAS